MYPRALLVDLLELGAATKAFTPRETSHVVSRLQGSRREAQRGLRPAFSSSLLLTLLAADRQPLAAFGAPAFQNGSSVLGAHPHQKSVRPFPVARIRLKCAFPLHDILCLDEPTMLRTFSEGVNARCLC